MRGRTRAGGGMPPKVATIFDVVSGGRTIGGGSPPGDEEAADGVTDGSAIMDDRMCTGAGAMENSWLVTH